MGRGQGQPLALLVAVVVVVATVTSATASGAEPAAAAGGTRFEPTDTVASSGGTRYGRRVRRPTRRPLLRFFRVRPARLFLYGRRARVSFRIDSRARRVRVTLLVRRRGSRRVIRRIRLGSRRTRRSHALRFSGREGGQLGEGRYVLGITARDRRGRRLRRGRHGKRRRRVRATRPISIRGHHFPLRGAFDFGGAGSRFGADRGDHSHRGQDLGAPSGTPVLAPRGGRVEAVNYQAAGAGHYIVLDGAGEDRDYVFMHLLSGSIRVRVGQRVRTGQRLASVGNTGRSFGSHLHFEIWVGGWFSGGRAVDPLPALRRWNRWS